MTMTKQTNPALLSGIERQYFEVQQANAPAGHVITGPHRRGQIWRCLGCAVEWSNGTHPAINESEDLTLPYPFNS